MKKTLYTLLISAGMSLCAVLNAQTVLLQDDFNSYAPGTLTNGNIPWASSIPGTDPARSWVTGPTGSTDDGGVQEIVSGTPFGRSGNVYGYHENAPRQLSTYSSVQLAEAYTGSDTWTLNVDFYIDELERGGTSNPWSAIAGVWENAVGSGNVLASVQVGRQSSSGNIQFAVTRNGGTSFITVAVEEQQWYTLTISGNHDTQLFDVRIFGEGYDESLTELQYARDTTRFDVISIGDTTANGWAAGRSNSLYLDNLSLTTIPEPGTYALILAGVAALFWIRKRYA